MDGDQVDVGQLAAAVARHLEMYQLRPATWRPEPHQVPPPGNWYGWLLNAGRGAGKTAAAARYVSTHVHGPPCLPGPVPHWVGIIAPTLGDGVTACFQGPSGLGSFDENARLLQTTGGTVVRWQNGSQAKMFGAHSQEDVERLRAGGNTCLVAGTLVQTKDGEVPIEDIRMGDRVWTRNGLRTVRRAGQTGVKSIWRLETELGRVIELTGDHEVLANGQWVESQFLEPGYTLTTWQTTSSTPECGGTSAETATTRTLVEGSSTDTSGNRRTELLHRVWTSIISMTVIERRRTRRGSRSSHTEITSASTRDEISPQLTRALVTRLGQIAKPEHSLASAAALRSSPEPCPSGIAHPAMRLATQPEKSPVGHSRNGCAACVQIPSPRVSVDRRALVHDAVLRCRPTGRVEPVYDLLVEHDHEFFANGILVSNCLIWAEELAAWRYLDASWQQMRFGLRSGPRPHWVASTTPKPRALIKKLIKKTPHNVVVTHATTDDNPHLESHVRAALDEDYGGTQMGQQELYAEILEQDVHALWQREDLNEFRLKEAPPLVRITVGVDPSGGAGEQGIVVAGKAFEDSIANGKTQRLAHGFVLADQTCSLSPDGWGRRAVQAAVDWEADDIVVEINFGGDMAISTIAGAAEVMGIAIPIRETRASRGKRVRAEPVSVLSARGRWHHVGRYEQLEDQLCTWVPDQADYSPDRLDAMVWTGWHQRLVGTSLRAPGNFGGLAVVRSIIS